MVNPAVDLVDSLVEFGAVNSCQLAGVGRSQVESWVEVELVVCFCS